MEQSKKRYFDELNIFRALIIAWVIIGHSFDADQSLLGFSHFYAYSFHMPAFFMLSGFLFSSKLKRSKGIKDKLTQVKDRAQRLIVPYIFFTAVSYVLKIFLENYANNELNSNVIRGFLLCEQNPNGGIWFLYALFLISVFALLICNLDNRIMFVIAIALKVGLSFCDSQIMPIYSFREFPIYFFAGVLLFDYYPAIIDKLNDFISKKKNSLLFIAGIIAMLVISVIATYYNTYINKNKILKLIVCIFNILLWYFIAVAINKTKMLKNASMVVGNYGMDIYVIGYYVQIIIRVIGKSILHLPYLAYSPLMCILGIILPIPISKYFVRKIKIARMLMLGDFSKSKKE